MRLPISGGATLRSWIISLTAIALAVALAASQRDSAERPSNCRVVGELVRVSDLGEGSGIAASRRTSGVFWAHNDSGDPVIFALDAEGSVTGRIRITGASVDDWEDVAVGPCSKASCLYIADVGDNDGDRMRVTIYRTPEPAPSDSETAPVEAFHGSYPEGPHDAESLFVTSEGEVFVVTKGSPGDIALYRFPMQSATGAARLERVGTPPSDWSKDAGDRPTAADISPDGRWVAVRTTAWVAFFPATEFIAGRWQESFRTDLRPLDEPRGEGIAFADDRTLVLAGESGGGLNRGGTFARLACAFTSQ